MVRNEWTEEIKKSFDFYISCKEKYGEYRAEVRDSVGQFSHDELLEVFGFKYQPEMDENGDELEVPLEKQELDMEITGNFPFVIIGELESTWDRGGDFKISTIQFVSLDDFTNPIFGMDRC